MYLEEITYYRNSCCPQFTPINYLLETPGFFHSDDEKAVMLSELPAIFKKHNIPLCRYEFLLFLNPNDNIADTFDIEDVLSSIDSTDEKERKDALLTKDFLDFYKKLEHISFDNNQRIIDKAINERYGYYYNKYDDNAFEKFKQHLMNNIPDSGFFDIEPLTDEDLEKCKPSWVDYKEQELRRHFYHIKETFHDAPAKFLSERFFRVYGILKDKYGEIEFSNASLNKDGYSIIDRASSLYLNDIIYEKSPTRFYKDYIPFIHFSDDLYDDFIEPFRNVFTESGWDEYKKQIESDRFKGKKMWCGYAERIEDVIDVLEVERVILEQNGYKDAVTLLPKLFQDYFRFALKYDEEIEYFKNSFKDTSDKTEAVYNMINYYGIENIPSELIAYLINNAFINHNTIKKVKVYK